MSYSRVTPRARTGTTGICEEADISAGQGIWINPPDRVAAVTIAVHIPQGKTGTFVIETCCNRPETIGNDGTGGYWDNIYGDNVVLSENATIMLANAVTGIRVRCLSADTTINVCFVG
ncbi:hypothetical protein [Treponema pectinovorum]|uniref:hypothetical protein n=1 Tax=Treponema pectinovorum TaxID=164 RepID=UPI0011C7EBB7|nr:hypothetical protein [Treponema pectinovorum]